MKSTETRPLYANPINFVEKCQNLVLPDTYIVVSPIMQFQKARPESMSSHSYLASVPQQTAQIIEPTHRQVALEGR